jgi:nucleotide-binding universal stress UspA family protein
MKAIKKLLFVTKFKELNFDDLLALLTLRKAGLEHVVFIYVIEREKVAMHRGMGYKKQAEVRLKEAANIRFINWAEDLFEQGLEVGVYIKVGKPVPEVIRAAEKEAADLIVIGRSAKGILEHLYAGSDVTEIIRRAAVPVLVYKDMVEDVRVLEKPFERPLLATDWSAASMRAVDYLKTMKDIVEEINVIHVADEKSLKQGDAMAVQKTRKQTRQRLEEVCENFEAEGMAARASVYIGDPIKEIETAAQEHQASMIVLGSSGKSAWVERWLGSVPQGIAEKTIFPTLIIPPKKAP